MRRVFHAGGYQITNQQSYLKEAGKKNVVIEVHIMEQDTILLRTLQIAIYYTVHMGQKNWSLMQI